MVALCDRARKSVAALKAEMSDDRHKNKADLLETSRQEIKSTEKLIREQCN